MFERISSFTEMWVLFRHFCSDYDWDQLDPQYFRFMNPYLNGSSTFTKYKEQIIRKQIFNIVFVK